MILKEPSLNLRKMRAQDAKKAHGCAADLGIDVRNDRRTQDLSADLLARGISMPVQWSVIAWALFRADVAGIFAAAGRKCR